MSRILFYLILIFNIKSLACAACYGRDVPEDSDAVSKMFKQKSEFYSNKQSSLINEKPACDFSKGNDNCKPESKRQAP